MIHIKDNVFHLKTATTSYVLKINEFKKLEQCYYGLLIEDSDLRALGIPWIMEVGSNVHYSKDIKPSSMDLMLLECPEPQMGDYRHIPLNIWVNGLQLSDLKFVSHQLTTVDDYSLPRAREPHQTLSITLEDEILKVLVHLNYLIYEDSDVIERFITVENLNPQPCVIKKCSVNFDFMNDNYDLYSLHGAWIKETHLQKQPIAIGQHVISSTTGASSNRSNPGFVVGKETDWFGFNLMYSGNHKSTIEQTSFKQLRISSGINDEMFEWILPSMDKFSSPSVMMSYANNLDTLTHQMHHFVNHHVIPPFFKQNPRPVVFNNWESTFFDFDEKRLLKLAKKANEVGCELFVVDDGWFKERDNDLSGLGNYEVNKKKFPKGLTPFIQQVKKMGMDFGLWVEPEMVNLESDLYRQHPQYALTSQRDMRFGRNQLVLDLTQEAVRNYIIKQLNHLLDTYDISYIKWDMNRHISDQGHQGHQQSFSHRYILGLYEILEKVFSHRQVLLESCSSGGNRFDLGMLYYSPQIWASDNTDPIERLKIQEGLNLLYPLSTISCHVSGALSQQTLRRTPLSTRYNVACFGVLGYELDLEELSSIELKEIKDQIKWYKKYRMLYQYGTFYRLSNGWQVSHDHQHMIGVYQSLGKAGSPPEKLKIKGLNPKNHFEFKAKGQRVMLNDMRELLHHVAPIKLHSQGLILKTASQYLSFKDQRQQLEASGQLLAQGIWLHSRYLGTGYHKDLRMGLDFNSSQYYLQQKEKAQ